MPTAVLTLAGAILDSTGAEAWAPPTAVCGGPAMARLMQPGETIAYPVRVEGVSLATGLYSTTGPNPETATAYGRSYFTVC